MKKRRWGIGGRPSGAEINATDARKGIKRLSVAFSMSFMRVPSACCSQSKRKSKTSNFGVTHCRATPKRRPIARPSLAFPSLPPWTERENSRNPAKGVFPLKRTIHTDRAFTPTPEMTLAAQKKAPTPVTERGQWFFAFSAAGRHKTIGENRLRRRRACGEKTY